MEIYIVRHGETVWNKEFRLQGTADIKLNKNGKDLALKTGIALKDTEINCIYSSPLNRAYTTAELIRGNRDIPIIKDDRIKELSFGDYEGRCKDELADTSFKDFFDNPKDYVPCENGETLSHLCERGADFMKDILSRHADDKRIMIVAHGAMNKALMMYVKKQDMSKFWSGGLQKNCNVIIIEYENGKFKVIEEQKTFY